jgi:DNA modification methylase
MQTFLNQIINSCCVQGLKTLPDNCVDCCVTSPPYYNLRDYGVSDQIGLEKTPDGYIARLVEVFAEVKRVLKPTGTFWLNIGDSYTGSGHGYLTELKGKQATNKGNLPMVNRPPAVVPTGLKAKDLIGIPWMLAFALRASGWYLRQDIIWHKPNPMPESVKDRCTKAHEYVFLLTKSAKYYFNNRAIMQPAAYDGRKSSIRKGSPKYAHEGATGIGIQTFAIRERERWKCDENGNFMRNKRSVWTVTTQLEKEAHYACFPQNLIIDCIKAGCPEGGIVLDPFMGSGTTAVVARKLNRNYVGFELNPDYIKIAGRKLKRELGAFM